MAKPDDIPQDVWEAAHSSIKTARSHGTTDRDTWADCISRVIMAERERCAVSAAIHSQYPITTDFDRGYAAARKDAAQKIREGR